MVALLLSILISSNCTKVYEGTKAFLKFEMEFNEPLTEDYAVNFEVYLNTPIGTETRGYVIIVPAGTTGSFTQFRPVYSTYVLTGFTMIGYGPVVQ